MENNKNILSIELNSLNNKLIIDSISILNAKFGGKFDIYGNEDKNLMIPHYNPILFKHKIINNINGKKCFLAVICDYGKNSFYINHIKEFDSIKDASSYCINFGGCDTVVKICKKYNLKHWCGKEIKYKLIEPIYFM